MSAGSPRWRAALAKLGLALAATAFALLVAEIGARVFDAVHPPPAPPPVDLELAKLPELHGFLELARPNLRGRRGGVLWRTNRFGFRGPDVTPEPAPGTYRIAIVGDSFVAGFGVPEEDAYAAQLQRLLGTAADGTRFEVLNLGLEGLNTHYVVQRATNLGAPLHPRLIVYGMTLNDIFEVGEDATRIQKDQVEMLRWLADTVQNLRSHLMRLVLPRLASLYAMGFSRDGFADLVVRSYADPEKFARVQRGFAALAALGRQSGICVHVLIHTDLAALRFGHRFVDVYTRIAEAARQAGLTVTSSYPAFRWRDSADLRLSLFDGHPNAEGHRILAEALYQGLRDLPPRCGFPPVE